MNANYRRRFDALVAARKFRRAEHVAAQWVAFHVRLRKRTWRSCDRCCKLPRPRNARQVRAANAAITDPLRIKWKLFPRFIGRHIRAEYARLAAGEKT